MNIQKLILKRPVSAFLIIAAIIIFGITSILGIRMEYFPDLEMPMQVVSIVYPGADAETIESMVTEKVEDLGKSLSNISSVASNSYENYMVVQFSYKYGTDLNEAYDDLKAELDRLKSDLPDECEAPVIMTVSIDNEATISLSLMGEEGVDVSKYATDTLLPELENVAGVEKAEVSGEKDPYVRIVLNEEKMNQYGLTISKVANYVSSADFNIPAGSMDLGNREMKVSARTMVNWQEDLPEVPLYTGDGALVRLGDVADFINLYEDDADSFSRYNGKGSVLVSVTAKKDASTIEVCDKVTEIVEQMSEGNYTFNVIHSSKDDIMDNLMEVLKTLVEGVLFSMFVLFVFFGDLKASLIVGSSMPLSLLAAMILLKSAGINMDLMTGTGLIIAIGMIVDNSIVILESCFRMKDEGKSFYDAAVKGAGTMMMSVLGSTLTTIVVYAPLTTTQGMSGAMNQPLCWSIIYTMTASLISAVSVVPLFFYLVKPKEKKNLPINKKLGVLGKGYEKIMGVLLKHRIKTVAAVLAMMAAAIFMASTLHVDLFPSSYDGSIETTARFRPGTKPEFIDKKISDIEKILLEDKKFDRVNLSVDGETASIKAYAVNNERSSEDAAAYYTEKFRNYTDMDISVMPLGTAGGLASLMSTGNTVKVTLAGKDLDSLTEGCSILAEKIVNVPGLLKIDNELETEETAARIVVNPRLAANYGLTPSGASMEIYYALSGVKADKFSEGGEEYDVKLEYPEGKYKSPEDLLQKEISLSDGTKITLRDIAKLEYVNLRREIRRLDGYFTAEVVATTTETAKYSAASEIKDIASEISYPEGVTVAESTMDKTLKEEMTKMGNALFMAVILVFLVMAIQFESVRFSLMVMACIPFSVIGSFTLMFIFAQPLSMMAMMGFLMLVGIVVNNGILLVDSINNFRQTMPLEEALLKAGSVRLRPILMTTLTTVLSMLPMVLSVASGMSMMRGMGLVIIGGLLASTCIAMFLMPVLYSLIGKK